MRLGYTTGCGILIRRYVQTIRGLVESSDRQLVGLASKYDASFARQRGPPGLAFPLQPNGQHEPGTGSERSRIAALVPPRREGSPMRWHRSRTPASRPRRRARRSGCATRHRASRRSSRWLRRPETTHSEALARARRRSPLHVVAPNDEMWDADQREADPALTGLERKLRDIGRALGDRLAGRFPARASPYEPGPARCRFRA